MGDSSLRLRILFEDNLVLVVSVVIVLGLLGGYVTYTTHVDPGTETEQYEVSSWSSTAQYTHEATVVRGTEVFDRGEVLENRNSYFEAIAPVLDGTFVYEYRATDGGDLRVETDTTLVLRSVTDGDDGEIEYWRDEHYLDSHVEESVGPGEPVEVPFSVNVTEMSQRIDVIEEQLGGTPGQTEIAVETHVDLEGTRNDQQVSETRLYEATIDAGGSVYSVEGAGPETESDERLGERTFETTYGPLRTVGGPLLLGIAVLGIVAIAAGRWNDTFVVSNDEREWYNYTALHDEFDEWITTGHVPDEAMTGAQVSVDSLDGLVDVAIDSNRRVIEDRDRGMCIVRVDDVVYTYDVPDAHRPGPGSDPLEVDSKADDPDEGRGNDDTSGEEADGA